MPGTATALSGGRFWAVAVAGVGVTQARSVREARAMAADLVEAMTGKAEDVDVHFELPDDVRPAVDHRAPPPPRRSAWHLSLPRSTAKLCAGWWSAAA